MAGQEGKLSGHRTAGSDSHSYVSLSLRLATIIERVAWPTLRKDWDTRVEGRYEDEQDFAQAIAVAFAVLLGILLTITVFADRWYLPDVGAQLVFPGLAVCATFAGIYQFDGFRVQRGHPRYINKASREILPLFASFAIVSILIAIQQPMWQADS